MTTPLVLTVPEAVSASRLSRSAIYRALQAGDLNAKKFGRRTLIPVVELQRYLDNLPAYPAAA